MLVGVFVAMAVGAVGTTAGGVTAGLVAGGAVLVATTGEGTGVGIGVESGDVFDGIAA